MDNTQYLITKTRDSVHFDDIKTFDDARKLFPVTDFGRTIYNDNNADGKQFQMLVEVSFEYSEGDTAWIFIQSLDKTSAEYFDNLDRQLQSIQNPFVEPVFLHSKIEGCLGVFGSAVLSDGYLFVYPQDNP